MVQKLEKGNLTCYHPVQVMGYRYKDLRLSVAIWEPHSMSWATRQGNPGIEIWDSAPLAFVLIKDERREKIILTKSTSSASMMRDHTCGLNTNGSPKPFWGTVTKAGSLVGTNTICLVWSVPGAWKRKVVCLWWHMPKEMHRWPHGLLGWKYKCSILTFCLTSCFTPPPQLLDAADTFE